jgi:hypothetical protein
VFVDCFICKHEAKAGHSRKAALFRVDCVYERKSGSLAASVGCLGSRRACWHGVNPLL